MSSSNPTRGHRGSLATNDNELNIRGMKSLNNIPQIDLHGYNVDNALRAVTDFLENHRRNRTNRNQFVLIITGKGVHSSNSGGPVLLGAVDSLLQRRQMEYTKYKTGCFIVKPNSGMVFASCSSRYHPAMKQDTKVVVVQPPSEDDAVFRRPKQIPILKRVMIPPHSSISSAAQSCDIMVEPINSFPPLNLSLDQNDLKNRVFDNYSNNLKNSVFDNYADNYPDISKVKVESFAMLREDQQRIKTEEEEYQEALKLSLVNDSKDSIQKQQEQKLLNEAIIASQQDEEFLLQQEEEYLLLKAIEASENLLEMQKQQLDFDENNIGVNVDEHDNSEWEEALRLSQHEYEMEQSKRSIDNEDEIILLQKILELSMNEQIYFHHDGDVIDVTESSSLSNDIDGY